MEDAAIRWRGFAPVVCAVVTTVLTACGGGSDPGTAGLSSTTGDGFAQAPTATLSGLSRQAIAERLYAGSPRTPEGFRLEPAPVGVVGPVATTHLKNTDTAAGAAANLRFELCTDDLAVATNWSETKALAMPVYADLVEVSGSTRTFELVRVPRNDLTARIRHRVFKCTYLDRTGTDLEAANGPAGHLSAPQVDAAELRNLSEYLWQFTAFNNADHVVLASIAGAGTASAALVHQIEMAKLFRAAPAAGGATDCDRIEVLRWTHTADPTGTVVRSLAAPLEFLARRENGRVTLCGG